jgi:hypothetical protein
MLIAAADAAMVGGGFILVVSLALQCRLLTRSRRWTVPREQRSSAAYVQQLPVMRRGRFDAHHLVLRFAVRTLERSGP